MAAKEANAENMDVDPDDDEYVPEGGIMIGKTVIQIWNRLRNRERSEPKLSNPITCDAGTEDNEPLIKSTTTNNNEFVIKSSNTEEKESDFNQCPINEDKEYLKSSDIENNEYLIKSSNIEDNEILTSLAVPETFVDGEYLKSEGNEVGEQSSQSNILRWSVCSIEDKISSIDNLSQAKHVQQKVIETFGQTVKVNEQKNIEKFAQAVEYTEQKGKDTENKVIASFSQAVKTSEEKYIASFPQAGKDPKEKVIASFPKVVEDSEEKVIESFCKVVKDTEETVLDVSCQQTQDPELNASSQWQVMDEISQQGINNPMVVNALSQWLATDSPSQQPPFNIFSGEEEDMSSLLDDILQVEPISSITSSSMNIGVYSECTDTVINSQNTIESNDFEDVLDLSKPKVETNFEDNFLSSSVLSQIANLLNYQECEICKHQAIDQSVTKCCRKIACSFCIETMLQLTNDCSLCDQPMNPNQSERYPSISSGHTENKTDEDEDKVWRTPEFANIHLEETGENANYSVIVNEEKTESNIVTECKSFHCTKCGMTGFRDRFNLNRHHQKMHSTVNISCKRCNVDFVDRLSYMKHSKDCYFSCSWQNCDFITKREDRLKTHERSHKKHTGNDEI